jgi:thymidylate synthase
MKKEKNIMSLADKLFIDMCKDIIANGTDTKGEKVRPKWEDGTPAYTIKKFGVVNRYDLRKEFPALTLRKTALKSAMDEILWIWQRKSNNIKDLNSKIWDSWADENGSIKRAYGYQIGKKYAHHKYSDADAELYKEYPSTSVFNVDDCLYVFLDQIDAVIYDLKHNPFSRRIMTNIYNFDDLYDMGLYPCAYSMTFNVTSENGKLVLNGILNQRSQDILAANNWNVCQYAILLMMIAQVCDMEAGELVHVIADAHVYDRHINIIKELIGREQYAAPKVRLNPEIKNFYDFTTDDLIVEDYVTGPQVKNIPIAI